MSTAFNGNDKTSTPVGSSRTTDNLPSLPTDQYDDSESELVFGIDLLHEMDIDDIKGLRKYFFDEEKLKFQKEKDAFRVGLALTRSEFIEAMQEVSGSTNLGPVAGKLFDVLNIDGTGRIKWDQVLDGIIERTEPGLDRTSNFWNPIDQDVKIYIADHCKREPIVKIVAIETKSTFCYAVVSRLGRVGVYDGGFTLMDSYKMALKPDEDTLRVFDREKDEKQRRSQTTWIADAVYIADNNSILYASSDRSLHLFDATCLIHIPLCRIIGLHNVPTCLEYYASNGPGIPSLLFIGDDCGDITIMKFHQAENSLFKKKHPDRLDCYYWLELTHQEEYVTYSVQKSVHKDAVTQITYCPLKETTISCSNDPSNTLVIRHIDGRREPYVFRVTRGIKCFHYESSMHIIATGSNDFVVRLWNEVVTKQPSISLYGHKAPVVDIRIIKYMSAVISLSREGVVKVWDINDYYCQMTLSIQFPILKVIGARIDFGTRSIYPGPKAVRDASSCTSNETSKEPSRISGMSGIGLDEVETQMSIMEIQKREENQWNRRNIVISCSNFIAVLRLTPLVLNVMESDFVENDGAFLPPPPREHFASAPTPWKIAETCAKTPEGSVESGSTGVSSCSSSSRDLETKRTKSTKHSKRFLNFTADAVKSPMENMNTKRTQYVIRQEQMKMLVEQCAPHLALDLHDLEPISFSKPLPVTRSMKEKGIDVSDPERVMNAEMFKDPTLISLGSSSAAQSPRSSKSSKNLSHKKKLGLSRVGRTTPDWFNEKLQSVLPNSISDDTIES